MIHRYYAPVQLLTLSPILYLTAQKGTSASTGPLKVRGRIWSNRPETGPAHKEWWKTFLCVKFLYTVGMCTNALATNK